MLQHTWADGRNRHYRQFVKKFQAFTHVRADSFASTSPTLCRTNLQSELALVDSEFVGNPRFIRHWSPGYDRWLQPYWSYSWLIPHVTKLWWLVIQSQKWNLEMLVYNYVVMDINKILHEKLQTDVASNCHHLMWIAVVFSRHWGVFTNNWFS